MTLFQLLVCSLISFFLLFDPALGKIASGVVHLNPGTFDKIVPKFKAVLVKFENAYAYGDKLKDFKQLADISVSQPDLLIGEISTRETDENKDLAEKFNIQKEDYPAYRLFLQEKGLEPIVYDGDKSPMDIARFIIKETGLWLDIAPNIQELDELVKEFWSASEEKRKEILQRAETWANAEENAEKKTYADMYVKTMTKIIEKGDEFVDGELERLEKLANKKVSKEKKEQLQDRASILTSFKYHKKDEL